MLQCSLSTTGTHNVVECNYNFHETIRHVDRIQDVHDMIYMIEGEWEIYQDGIPYNIKAGDILFLNAGHHHYGLKSCNGIVKTIYIHVNCLPDDNCGVNLTQNANSFVFPAKLSVPTSDSVPSLLKSIVSSYWSNSIYARSQAQAYLTLLFSEISLLSAENNVISDRSVLMDKLIRTMRNSTQHFFSNDELCKLANISRKTLYNYFVNVTGMSPHEYQLISKLNEAKEVIERRPELTLKEIASMFGFCDDYHFSRSFKRHFGYSPKRRI